MKKKMDYLEYKIQDNFNTYRLFFILFTFFKKKSSFDYK